jgi:methylenetetrahydrofolate dehydrogenase (NADP+) / methenyltetrahydrofolate cyclohydrolase
MSAILLDGKAVAARIREEVAAEVARMAADGMAAPGLAVVLVGDDPGSAIYVRNKGRAAEQAGIGFQLLRPPADSTTSQLITVVRDLDRDDRVDAILVQLPLPAHIDADAVIESISPEKDADGFHPFNFGRLAEGRTLKVGPGTPLGVMALLHRYDIPIAGQRAVVIGRSRIVGRPLALMLINANATVTVCHSQTKDLPAVSREADILVAAIGRSRAITAAYVKPGACVIDVGINAQAGGGITGDVDAASVGPIAGWLTPVPGGVGPMTIAMLLRNSVALASARRLRAAV